MNDYIPAFPSEQGHIPDGTWNQTYNPGMSLRDYFAAKALPHACARERYLIDKYGDKLTSHVAAAAALAYEIADAMLAEGNRDRQVEAIAEEERLQDEQDNSQFGVGA